MTQTRSAAHHCEEQFPPVTEREQWPEPVPSGELQGRRPHGLKLLVQETFSVSERFAQKSKATVPAVEVKAFQGTLPFIAKVIFNSESKSKAGKEFTNEKKKKFGVGLTGSGLGNASA